DVACSLGSAAYRAKLDFIGVGVAGLLTNNDPHADSLHYGLRGGLHDLLFGSDAVRHPILEEQIGVVPASSERGGNQLIDLPNRQSIFVEKELNRLLAHSDKSNRALTLHSSGQWRSARTTLIQTRTTFTRTGRRRFLLKPNR